MQLPAPFQKALHILCRGGVSPGYSTGGIGFCFQLLLYLSAFVIISVIVFTIVHQNFLTLLPVHTG